jgi:hypothetical protein
MCQGSRLKGAGALRVARATTIPLRSNTALSSSRLPGTQTRPKPSTSPKQGASRSGFESSNDRQDTLRPKTQGGNPRLISHSERLENISA